MRRLKQSGRVKNRRIVQRRLACKHNGLNIHVRIVIVQLRAPVVLMQVTRANDVKLFTIVKLSTNLWQMVDCQIAAHENFAQTLNRL